MTFAAAIETRPLRWLRTPENALFAALVAFHLVPIWSATYFPSQDGPAHINNANVLREYNHPDRTVFREYYVLNTNPEPNWAGHIVLAALMYVVPMLVAEKLLLSGYVLLLALSARYAAGAVRPEGRWVAVLAFPFTYNYLLHMGFYNFCYSLPMYFIVLGLWVRHGHNLGVRNALVLAVASLGLYFAHVVSLVTAYLAIGGLATALTAVDLIRLAARRGADAGPVWRRFRSRTLITAGALLPPVLLTANFLSQKGTAHSARLAAKLQWDRLYMVESLVSYSDHELPLARAVFWTFVVVTAYCLVRKVVLRHWTRWDALLLVVAGYVLVYFRTPDGMSGGGFVSHRLILYPFLALILWFAAQSYCRLSRYIIQGATAAIAIAMLVVHTTSYARLNDYLDEYLSGADLIEPNSTLLPLCFTHNGYDDGKFLSKRIGLFLHASGHIAARRRIVELDNYEGNTTYFPVLFRYELNAFHHMGTLEAQPPKVDIASYVAKTGGRVDYVLVWNVRDDQRGLPDTKAIERELDDGYHLIHTSEPRSLMQLYRRDDLAAADGDESDG
ncbi:hypothetical protein HN371_20325 [Candidatus Poribacteria bacterium]|jgi:hypothetical protein|nr:hypothetical protein [Candidatus Poribacteria bacterium]MBT5536796.1 hypothetical protein [Candidatus Poribacteria bacterium]MBT5710841.1 hypothetical protein [Candidatus Poribacteria bacterium]MBT7804116.1 hypothetical protein [Candidatus Poribacteria bacterium]